MASFLPRAASRALRSSARPTLSFQRPAAPLLRRGIALPAEQPRLRLGSEGKLDWRRSQAGKGEG
jgi:hypothetical protein